MAKITNNSTAIEIKSSDLKKAIVKRNKELRADNNRLTLLIKSIEKSIDDIKDLQSTEESNLQSAKNKVKYQKSLLSKLEDKYKERDDKLESVSVKIVEYQSEENKLVENIANLKTQISALNSEVTSLKAATDDYSTMAKEMEDMEVKILTYKDDTAKLKSSNTRYRKTNKDLESKHNDISKQLEARRLDLDMSMERMDAELEIKKKDILMKEEVLNAEISSLDNDIALKNDNLIKLESKAVAASKKLSDQADKLAKAKSDTKKEIEKINKIKDQFKSWKISAVDELARMKLRGRMKNIDKAGLKDVLG